ncbi:endonuclease [Rhodococcus maanshanensis]|uniref:endonuclease n=1 Tax=Rhodococcus maanshanensis TaxID=183556 RepID=UPI0022B5049F|nr:endonuclease [Rhodococcus maanshanensis]MCZ4558911.1 endonuclease [Rhodococcus maanshanensis]
MRSDTDRTIVSALLDEAGNTYAAQAGIRLKDTPAPLFQLLILALLLSARISADIAVAAAAELFRARLRSPRAVRAAERRTIIAALGRGHYVRYDESTATCLKNAAARVEDLYRDDLRRLARESDHDVAKATRLLTDFDGIGPVGAAIFLREVQDVWSWVRPYFDERAAQSAEGLRLPTDPHRLAELAPPDRLGELAAALVRASLDEDLRAQTGRT